MKMVLPAITVLLLSICAVNVKPALTKSGGSNSSNPFLYPCTSNSQCDVPGLNTCHMSPENQPNTWFCDCYWLTGDVRCTKNKDCCTNICNNGQCAATGGGQGALCNAVHQDCAVGYACTPWGDAGYCDRSVKCPNGYQLAKGYDTTLCINNKTNQAKNCPAPGYNATIVNAADRTNYWTALQNMGAPAKTFQIDGTLKPGPQFVTSDGQVVDYNPYQIPIDQCNDRTQLFVIFLPPENGGILKYLCGYPCPPKCALNQLCATNPI